MVVNWPGFIVVLIVSLLYGTIAIISPLSVIKVIGFLPISIDSELYPNKDSPARKRGEYLPYENPEEFKRRFWHALFVTRLSGVVAWVIFFLLIV